MSRHHELTPVPDHLVWGYLDAGVPPALHVASGDTVTMTAWGAGTEIHLPADRSRVDPRHLAALQRLERGPASHILAGPVHVEGAEPGDTLEIEILDVSLAADWGFTAIAPGRGTLPDDFPEPALIHSDIDRGNRTARLPWGKELALSPFFGILAVAPAPELGRCSTVPPGPFGGNMDNKELQAGATLYLPVFNPGALFYAGDGHGIQGDGEVCLTALETALTGTFRLTVRKRLGYRQPFIETPSHLIGVGLDRDLDEAARQAVRELIAHVCRRTELSREQAYMLCSLVADLHVTQTVDEVLGCHMMLDKRHL